MDVCRDTICVAEDEKAWGSVKKLWDDVNELKAKRKENKSIYVITFCASKVSSNDPIYAEQYIFPSKNIRQIVLDICGDIGDSFTAKELFAKINDAYDRITEDKYDELSFLVCDVLLYKAYELLREHATNTFDSLDKQLNICIILDSMRIFPDGVENSVKTLREINEKAKMNTDWLDINAVWAIAMLDYKMHDYENTLVFLDRYLHMSANMEDDITKERRIHSKIYKGYCHEKLTSKPDMLPEKKAQSFGDAIHTFLELLQEIDENNPKYQNYITELHHGLGHFYNERAVFSASPNTENDLCEARKHMWIALKNSKDFYSCFGSLYHEYGDYECANCLFEEAMRQKEIVSNEELKNEMKFYLAQTGAALSVEDQAESNFTEFENYCKSTYNYDGIVHARIFKIRTYLRKTPFIPNLRDRSQIRNQLNAYLQELIEYPLSNYASQSIKDEYEKTLLILNIFRTLYAGKTFCWNEGDLIYYLNMFISMMPEIASVADLLKKRDKTTATRLYRIHINKVPVWCVSGEDLVSILAEPGLLEELSRNGIALDGPIPISGREAERVHNTIHGNMVPDLVMLVQPLMEDGEFEDEISMIAHGANELYFLISRDRSAHYSHSWLESQVENIQLEIYQSDTLLDLLRRAYCIRCLEILRKELLRPIPLFSLAPTHFSASYNFQLGEDIDLQTIVLHENKQHQMIAHLKYVDEKYSTHTDRRNTVAVAHKAFSVFDKLNCAPGVFTICFPSPAYIKQNDDCYVSYRVLDATSFPRGYVAHELESNTIYTTKVLPSYSKAYWSLRKSLANRENCDRSNGKTTCIHHFERQDVVKDLCKELLKYVISFDDLCQQKMDYNCILWHNGRQEEYIYCVLSKPGTNDPCRGYLDPLYNGNKPSVFISYANEQEGTPDADAYLREITDFANLLQRKGYKVFLDRASGSHNWENVMLEGFKQDKVIALLSPAYKRKAENQIESGVAHESKVIKELLLKQPQKVVIASLPSKSGFSLDELRPSLFVGEHVIMLTNQNKYDELFRRLDGTPDIILTPVK